MAWSVRALLPPVLVLLAAGCSEPGSADDPHAADVRLTAIEQKIAEGEARLARVRQALDEEQAKVEVARGEADFQGCRAQRFELRAEVERRRSECAREIATHNLCVAKNSEDSANAGLGGCLVGIAAAAATGGAAAPWALGGCGLGVAAGKLANDECPTPVCAEALASTEAAVLRERGFAAVPRCGGWLGVEFELVTVELGGVRVDRVLPGTYAAAVGITPGDVIIELRGKLVANRAKLGEILEDTKLGAPLKVAIVRAGRRLDLRGRAAGGDLQGNGGRKALLGIEGTDIPSVRLTRGVTVLAVAPAGPAHEIIRPGETLADIAVPMRPGRTTMRALNVTEPGEIDAVLDEVRAEEEISLGVVGSGGRRTVTLRLAKRDGRTGT